jgi:hypothetical protein
MARLVVRIRRATTKTSASHDVGDLTLSAKRGFSMPMSTTIRSLRLAVMLAIAGSLAACGDTETETTATDNGAAAPGDTAAASTSIPHLSNGKPDFNGIWARPYVADMSAAGNGRTQTGPGELPFTDAGRLNFENYNPSTGDYTGVCMPFGLMRAMNSPDPIQFVQTDTHFAYLYEQNTWFHVVNLDGQNHSPGVPAWFGHTVATWDGDTLVLTTSEFNGKTRLDTVGHPHSDQLVVTERLTRSDAETLDYEVTINDPVYYSQPWTNKRVFTLQKDFELIEYSCEENNKSVWEGRIVPPDYDNWHTYDTAPETPSQ